MYLYRVEPVVLGDDIQLLRTPLADLVINLQHQVVIASQQLDDDIDATLFHMDNTTLSFLQPELVTMCLNPGQGALNRFARFQSDFLLVWQGGDLWRRRGSTLQGNRGSCWQHSHSNADCCEHGKQAPGNSATKARTT